MSHEYLHFMDGEFVPSSASKTFEKRSPLDGTLLAEGARREPQARQT